MSADRLLVTMTASELEGLIARAAEAAAARVLAESSEPEVLTLKEVGALLKRTTKTVAMLVEKHELPAHPLGGGHLRFLRTEVLEWMRKQKG